jgi:hypothetical protein
MSEELDLLISLGQAINMSRVWAASELRDSVRKVLQKRLSARAESSR